ncbi:GTP-binding protein, chloroplastic [Cinnamomum micranthum f. kanehirae]|uniref:GTP-binding protein, chloroplastic n=1 Tax=Cinnamomum micranthum f. kanehirae TaxID=337451 RepID=A0A443NHD4_9MAGN|nr:GTP-binding protein, chloroplastic [Cinnamomum micranthum f. kanehirae]
MWPKSGHLQAEVVRNVNTHLDWRVGDRAEMRSNEITTKGGNAISRTESKSLKKKKRRTSAMFKSISLLRTPFRALPQTLFSFSTRSLPPTPNHLSFFFRNPINPISPTLTSLSSSILFSPFSHSSRQKKLDEDDSSGDDDRFVVYKDPKSPPRLFVVQPRLRPDTLMQAKLSEALNLANSLEEQRDSDLDGDFGSEEMPPHLVVQNPAARSPKAHADTYFGQGTVDTIKIHLNALESEDTLDAVFVNTILSGIQQRNLERAWGKPVLDRVGLIIEIFNAHAQTKEAKLQSELAALMYRKTRLVRLRGPDGRLTFGASGEAEVVSARGRGSGGRGFISGAGETELQLQRRRILERRNHLLSQIEEVRRTRALQRSSRKRRGGLQGQGLATVAVVGYTNAGKSTLVSALSDSDLYSDDRLFATVDPRIRSVFLPSGRKVLLSDTVGFISELPVQLVEAFHATLEEVVEADLLVHVLDSSALNLDEQRSSVLQVLQQIGVSEEKLQNMIEVWNKIDLLEKKSETDESLDQGEDDENGSFSETEDHVAGNELQSGDAVGEDDVAVNLSAGETVDGPQEESTEDVKMTVEVVPCQAQDVQRVETSAIMGVGLQELLSLIDEKCRGSSRTLSGLFSPLRWTSRIKETATMVEKTCFSG